jgi:hypothetical protein
LVEEELGNGFANLLLRYILLKLAIMREDVENRENGYAEINAPVVILRESTTEDLKEGFYIKDGVPWLSSSSSRLKS